MRAGVIAVLLLMATILAGCLAEEPSADECKGEDCPQDAPMDGPKMPPPPRGDLELPNSTYPLYQMRDCEMIAIGVQVPHEMIREVVPAEFDLMPSFGVPALARVSVLIDRCPQLLNETRLFGEGHIYMAKAMVRPNNNTWTESGMPNFYVLDVASDNDAWNQAMKNAFLPFETGVFDWDMMDLPEDNFHWDFSMATDNWSLETSFLQIAREAQDLGHDLHMWYGDGPFHRVTEHTNYVSAGRPAAGLVVHEGDSVFSETFPGPVIPYDLTNWRSEKTTLLQYDGAFDTP